MVNHNTSSQPVLECAPINCEPIAKIIEATKEDVVKKFRALIEQTDYVFGKIEEMESKDDINPLIESLTILEADTLGALTKFKKLTDEHATSAMFEDLLSVYLEPSTNGNETTSSLATRIVKPVIQALQRSVLPSEY